MATDMEKIRLQGQGRIADLRRAQKAYKCAECGYPIEPGEQYYSVITTGSGLGGIKYPDAVHTACIENHLSV